MLIYLSMIESEADKSLFEQLYIRYKGLMYHIAYRILQNREDAEDAVHQAFVSITKNIKKITEVDCPKTYGYIVTIIERKSIDSLRANKHIVSTDFEESEPGIEIPPPGEGGLADAIAKLNPLAEQNLLITDASERILTATMLGCASRVILKSIPMVLVCGKDSNTPAVKYAEYSGYDIRYADLDSGASELLEPGDGKCPVATILEAGEGGMTHAQSGIVLGRILEYVCGANNHPNLAILIDDLPALGQVPHIENALAMSSKINVRFCMTAEHMSEVAAAYPATHIKIIENCKVFF